MGRSGGLGVPAHVTIVFPFVEPNAIDDQALASLAEAVASVGAFECHFQGTGWFDDDVVWLAPDPPEPSGDSRPRSGVPFLATRLTAALMTR